MVKTTVAQLAKNLNVDYPVAAAVVKLMITQGKGKEVGKQPAITGKGRSSSIYELEDHFSVFLGDAA
jgi:hypothetical protein